MLQSEATEARPFYSVSYQYKSNWPFTEYYELTNNKNKTTMSGTDDEKLAIAAAKFIINKYSYYNSVYVSKSVDCYNHKQILKIKRLPSGKFIIVKNDDKTTAELKEKLD